MDDNKQLQTLMERIDQANQKQAAYAKWQCIFSAAAAVCCGVVLVIVLCLLPQVNQMATQAETVLTDMQQVTSQLAQADWEGLVRDLEQVSQQMANANLGGLAQDVSGLVQSSQAGIEEALGKLNGIDFGALNQAIQDLAAVVKPLASFADRFR